MKLFEFKQVLTPQGKLLEGVAISPLTSPIASGGDFQAAIFRFSPGGRIHRHRATTNQIIAVLAGAGEVAAEDGRFDRLEEGEAVFFMKGEDHESRSRDGMTALIIEGESIHPFVRPDQ